MSTSKILTIYLILLLIFATTSCVPKEDKLKIDDEIVLQTGSFKITRYEYEKNKKKELEDHSFKNSEDWLKSYINDSYFLADAYALKYDTISAISKKVNYALITMLGKVKGYLWNKVEEPKLVFSEKEIKEVYRKRNKLFDLEYFLFPDRMSFNSTLNNDTCIKTGADFRKIVDKSRTNSVKYVNTQLLYPYNELEPAKKQIYSLKQDEILKLPFKNGKILLAYAKNVTAISQTEFNKEKRNISSILEHLKEKQIVDDKQFSIFQKANIVINEQVSDSILKKLKNGISIKDSKTLLQDTLLKYLFNEKLNILVVADFLDYYYYNPFMFAITDKESLNEVLRNFVIEKYLYAESENLGITKDKKLILDKRNYMNRLILDVYYQNNFYATKISDKDMLDYYNTNKQTFSQCKTCYVSVFIFRDKISAFSNLNSLYKIISQDGIKNPSDSSLIGLLSYSPNEIIETKNKKYPEALIHEIFISKINTPIGPLELDNHVKIIVKTKEEGEETEPYALVKEIIQKQLKEESMKKIKDKKLTELMKKYNVEINKIQKKE